MKKIWILGIVVVVILAIIFIPRIFKSEGDKEVKFRILEANEVPQKVQDLIPRYLAEERALACKLDNEVYIIVTRGEKKTAGYSVTLDKLVKVKKDDSFDLIAHAEYSDPKPDQMVAQVITYPMVIAKADLDNLPDKIKLEVEYKE
ncbi:protease complex subunit PrcB family protein [Brassicibacter mesophilus]|uniref:protease complex subunit PrcB family protein n=1 Tax=Brassicibacter mesophilus TaxID=745119 RepID=UPI003D1BD530